MSDHEVVERLGDERVLAIVRTEDLGLAAKMMAGIARAGISVAEVSLSTPRGLEALESAVAAHGDDLIVGAGTVRSVADARAAVAAGARFLVSPGLDLDVNDEARANGVPHIPGVMTPTEVGSALSAQIELLKLFPAGRLGPGYITDLLGPFPGTRFVATGGVKLDDAPAFLGAGAFAVAFGSSLFPPDGSTRAAALAGRFQLIATTSTEESRAD